jgi:hypothetical protein
MRSAFAAVALSLLAGAAAGAAAEPSLKARPPAPPSHAGETRCADCHTPEGWSPARFQHERTGFPLEGRHAEASCKGCHPATFKEVKGRTCIQCHRDPHGGRSVQRCERCHDARSWRATFDADVHRRTNFPLQGRHALIPCEECHGDRRDRAFARPTVECYACHESQFRATALGSLDHVGAGLPHDCRPCHTWWRFSPAFFPQHEACFPIASGRHSGFRCLQCHVPNIPVPFPTACNTGNAHCWGCHASVCARHEQVSGFNCTNDQACYRCHPTGTAGGDGGGGLRVPGVLRKGMRR